MNANTAKEILEYIVKLEVIVGEQTIFRQKVPQKSWRELKDYAEGRKIAHAWSIEDVFEKLGELKDDDDIPENFTLDEEQAIDILKTASEKMYEGNDTMLEAIEEAVREYINTIV